jgi:DNA-binding response OmpR family regulator
MHSFNRMHTTEKRKDVLLAEDDHDDVDIFKTAAKGITIPIKLRVAHDGNALFVELKKAIPNMLFLDIHMPCKDGISCILQIRKNRKYDRMPVVMLSSNTHKDYIDKSYRYGANYYVIKPLSITAFTERIQHVLSREWDKEFLYPSREEFLLA